MDEAIKQSRELLTQYSKQLDMSAVKLMPNCPIRFEVSCSDIPTTPSKRGKKSRKGKEERKDSKDEDPGKKRKATDNKEDTRPTKIRKYDFTKHRSQFELLEELLQLTEQFGTKMANLIYYLRRLWSHTPEARVIIFSEVMISKWTLTVCSTIRFFKK